MKLLKQTEEYIMDSEEEAIRIIKGFKDAATSNGYEVEFATYYKKIINENSIYKEIYICLIVKVFEEY